MDCELCGKPDAQTKIKIESTFMKVCARCAKHGQVLQEKHVIQKPATYATPSETNQILNPNYAKIIRDTREQLGIKQEHLAKMLAEKESLIQHIERGEFRPGIELARKIEKKLNVKLIEKIEETRVEMGKKKSSGMTIGDLFQRAQ